MCIGPKLWESLDKGSVIPYNKDPLSVDGLNSFDNFTSRSWVNSQNEVVYADFLWVRL